MTRSTTLRLDRIRKEKWRVRRLDGPLRIPADVIRDHLLKLRAAGVGQPRIAEASGVHRNTIQRIESGRAVWVFRDTANALLCTTVTPANGARVDACGTRRRLEGLHLSGWTWVQISAGTGLEVSTLTTALKARLVTYRTAQLVTRFADTAGRPPTRTTSERRAASTARNRALRRGWLPLSVWDDPDDPTEEPKGVRNVAA